MYGRHEHSEALRRIMRVANHLQDERRELQSLRDDLLQDAPGETEAARQALRDISVILRGLCKSLDAVPEELPTPMAEPTGLWDALARGARERGES